MIEFCGRSESGRLGVLVALCPVLPGRGPVLNSASLRPRASLTPTINSVSLGISAALTSMSDICMGSLLPKCWPPYSWGGWRGAGADDSPVRPSDRLGPTCGARLEYDELGCGSDMLCFLQRIQRYCYGTSSVLGQRELISASQRAVLHRTSNTLDGHKSAGMVDSDWCFGRNCGVSKAYLLEAQDSELLPGHDDHGHKYRVSPIGQENSFLFGGQTNSKQQFNKASKPAPCFNWVPRVVQKPK